MKSVLILYAEVKSSNVLEIAADFKRSLFTVTYANETTYLYRNVTNEEALDIFNADSIGSQLHKKIKSKPTVKVKARALEACKYEDKKIEQLFTAKENNTKE